MGSGRCSLSPTNTAIMVIFVLQLLSTVERLIFDFLGYMWAPIMGNFLQIICVIIGIFGVCQYRPCLVAVYSIWSLLWIGWNIFVICLYLEIGILSRTRELYILNIGTKNKSWWLEHGIGCQVTNNTWEKNYHGETSRPIPPEEFVEGCLVEYYYVEFIHAAVQCLFSFFGFIISCITIYMYTEEDESSTSVNDEMEFVKMRYKSPARNSFKSSYNYGINHATSFDSLGAGGSPSVISSEQPPSYDNHMYDSTAACYSTPASGVGVSRSTAANNPLYATVDRQSLRNKASQRSKSSKKDSNKRKDLPWVHVSPSSNYTNHQLTNY
ncbi:sodium/potassium-transporting ATPase subunit beta-1-interacting protein 3 isoform X2 [Octopus sinensis]|uniref:Sodium/potassium-transporting ATPase subunit beta-1-interacting protein n=1 Tax=Octopus sinensis TaxID=2607531 RepID=A0A6P7S5A2_9MOLL|nr:sodium/potassium-transporting ATPase subunit beta-1-interacting protein 3 isoform X2 [Octopus sinensis]